MINRLNEIIQKNIKVKILKIKARNNSNLVFSCDYISIDETFIREYYYRGKYFSEVYYLYLYNIIVLSSQKNIFQNQNIEIIIDIENLKKKNIALSSIKINPVSDIKLNSKDLLIPCQIDFENFNRNNLFDLGYEYYNQNLIDIFYHWSESNSKLINHHKIQYTYCKATMLYSDLPENILNNNVIIDGLNVSNIFHFYNILAEKLLGEKRYLCNSLDSLEDSLSFMNQIENNIIIQLINSQILIEKLIEYNDHDFLNQFKRILKHHNIDLIIK